MRPERVPSLTKVLHAAVLNPPSGLDSQTMAGLVDKPYQTLMSELSGQPGHKLGADLVIPLIRVTGSLEPVKFQCRQLGGSFIPLPETAPTPRGLVCGLASSIKEFSEFTSQTAASIADGNVTRDQLSRIEKEGYEAIEGILAMMKLARTTHEEKYGG